MDRANPAKCGGPGSQESSCDRMIGLQRLLREAATKRPRRLAQPGGEGDSLRSRGRVIGIDVFAQALCRHCAAPLNNISLLKEQVAT